MPQLRPRPLALHIRKKSVLIGCGKAFKASVHSLPDIFHIAFLCRPDIEKISPVLKPQAFGWMEKAVSNPFLTKPELFLHLLLRHLFSGKAVHLNIKSDRRSRKRAAPDGTAVADGKMEFRMLRKIRLPVFSFLNPPGIRFRPSGCRKTSALAQADGFPYFPSSIPMWQLPAASWTRSSVRTRPEKDCSPL